MKIYNNLEGKRWEDLSDFSQEYLLGQAYEYKETSYFRKKDSIECILDLTATFSISANIADEGYIINKDEEIYRTNSDYADNMIIFNIEVFDNWENKDTATIEFSEHDIIEQLQKDNYSNDFFYAELIKTSYKDLDEDEEEKEKHDEGFNVDIYQDDNNSMKVFISNFDILKLEMKFKVVYMNGESVNITLTSEVNSYYFDINLDRK